MISGRGHRLLVGDHRQRLERRQRELQRRLQALDEAADRVVVLGLGGHLVAAGDFADGDAVLGLIELRDQLLEKGVHSLPGLAYSDRRVCASVSGSSVT